MFYKPTLKGISRKYRKALRHQGVRWFPTKGALHVVNGDGKLLEVEEVREAKIFDKLIPVAGPAQSPLTVDAAPPPPQLMDNPGTADDCPLPQVYRRVERTGKDGENVKKRVDYRLVKNPKGGERYWTKREVEGKPRWVEVDYSKLLAEAVA